jgi:hypothetical protein
MTPLAHHAGEDALVNLLLLGGSWLPVAVAVGRPRLAALLARLTGEDGPDGEAEMQAGEPPGRPEPASG